MKKHLLLWMLVAAAASACQFNKSASSDPSIGLSTNGNGLSSGNNYLEVNDQAHSDNTFLYGEKLSIVFDDMQGFKKQGTEVFPGMSLTILDDKGKKVLQEADLYADYTDPITMSPLKMISYISVGRPMMSGKSYTAHVHIWDKKGDGTFDAELKFRVRKNPAIVNTGKSAGAGFTEVVVIDEATGKSISGDKITAGHSYRLLMEGIEGFSSNNGTCEVGASIVAREHTTGETLFEAADFLSENATAEEKELNDGLISPSFSISGKGYACDLEMVVWDKHSNAKVKVALRLRAV